MDGSKKIDDPMSMEVFVGVVMNSGDSNAPLKITHNESPMPFLFVGHGSPMNAIEEKEFSASWCELGRSLPKQVAQKSWNPAP